MEVTTLAIEKLKEVMEEQGETNGSLRVVAIPAETGGLQYMLTMENETQADDTVMAKEGVNFLMDSDSAPSWEKATIDYVENLGGQVGFVINNPMFSSAGGCGGGCSCGRGAAAVAAAAAVGGAAAVAVAAAAVAADTKQNQSIQRQQKGLQNTEALFVDFQTISEFNSIIQPNSHDDRHVL
ncbi:MAG: hypothetical protein CM1200mP22_18370 [Dehalococcoidia bacterium]|nr:MAG: hypothetical protein CM1200mP22_18370 [Dehalococcoidia bacterium]